MTTTKRTMAIASLSLAFAACGGPSKTAGSDSMGSTEPSADHPCTPDGDSNPCGEMAAATQPADAEVPVPDWKSWTKVSKKRFLSKSHHDSWVEIYVPAQYADGYVSGATPPDGMKLVKAQYASENANEPESLTVMVRREGSSESNWFWGMYAADGQHAKGQGELASCISCHQSADNSLFRQLE